MPELPGYCSFVKSLPEVASYPMLLCTRPLVNVAIAAMEGTPMRAFATLLPRGDQAMPERDVNSRTAPLTGHVGEIRVSGTAELCAQPDRAALWIRVNSVKESVSEAGSSVTRRMDYILQSLRHHGVQEANMRVTKELRREENMYHLEAEVYAEFQDFGKMHSVSSTLLEKLGGTVTVSAPHFSHSTECLSKLRQRACVTAVADAQQKAREVCNLLGQSLGRPLMVKEEDSKEWGGVNEDAPTLTPLTLQHKIGQASVSVSVRVLVCFQLRPRERARKRL